MNLKQITDTPVWSLYEKGRNYHRLTGIYTDTDRNYRMYNGNQWEGAKLGDVEPVQKNFIKPIVKYKLSVIHDNLYAPVFSSLNQDPAFRETGERLCRMLGRYAAAVFERDKLDFKGRRVTKDAAINGEGIIYVDFDEKTMLPVNQIIKKNDIYYGNENDDDIQSQPYILLRRRMSQTQALALAEGFGVSREKRKLIQGDNDTFEESGEDAKRELDPMVTVVYKLYKQDTVRFSVATRYVTLAEDLDTGLTLYPVAHFNWEEKEGSARGEGEVRFLIPNQIEVNRTEVRRVLTVKYQAYPTRVVDTSRVSNPEALNRVGVTVRTNGQPVEDVAKIVGVIPPAQMSADVVRLQEDLISLSRELAGAGDTATGQVDPQSASGRAILAVQQASQAPMTEQKESFKNFLEDLARIWLEYLTVHAVYGAVLQEETVDPDTGENTPVQVIVSQARLRQLQAAVKIDITPKSVYDRFAQEQTIENMMLQGLFSPQRVGELEVYGELLDDDAVAPKVKILEAARRIRQQQSRIAAIEARAQALQQRARKVLEREVGSDE